MTPRSIYQADIDKRSNIIRHLHYSLNQAKRLGNNYVTRWEKGTCIRVPLEQVRAMIYELAKMQSVSKRGFGVYIRNNR